MSKRYNRNEAFRYEFGKPLECSLSFFAKSEDGEKKGGPYVGDLINMSPKGLQVSIGTNDLEKEKITNIEITFTIAETPLTLKGEIVWRRNYLSGYLYGIHLLDEGMEKTIIEELKRYTKNLKSV
ncbi:PilZ domain-containing protein [Halalkalibacter alkalisediminis]|uniref:PilZ domain-containing protein n=1 Tax=Halalkalibacter alkalisediminis TaxID=935616 RepID=A0ABV6NLZ9_9BACI|nr:PilZ domain-containing protein [Halalkalibacter alkalisediminis]